MRKISSEKDIEAKRKRNTLILSVIMLAILVLGTAGYAFISSSSSSNQGQEGSDGGIVNGRWITTVDGLQFSFANSPDSVTDIPVDITASTLMYSGLPLYLVSENNAINNEIATTIGRYASRVQSACYGECDKDLPEKDCSENLIIWTDSTEGKVYQEQNCVFIEGDLRAVDAFLFETLGI